MLVPGPEGGTLRGGATWSRRRLLGLAGASVLVAVGAFGLTRAPSGCAPRDPLAGLDEDVNEAMAAWEVPGLALAVVKDDVVVLARGYGVRERGKPERVDERTLFSVASCTKAFTAAALGTLVDEGKLSWDEPVAKHLPELVMHDPYVTAHLTARDLLTHRSGLPPYAADHLWQGSSFGRDEVLRRLRHQKPRGEFRVDYGYSNVMYIAAGQLVAAVAGKGWDDVVRERLLQPLGMQESTTRATAQAAAGNRASAHMTIEGEVQSLPSPALDNVAAAAGLWSSATEMASWLRLHLGRGTFEGKEVLSPAVAREMITPQRVLSVSEEDEALEGTHFAAYGLGFSLYDYKGRKVVRHSGEMDGMRSLVAMIPEERLGIVVLTNLTPHGLTDALVYRIVDGYLGAPERDWSGELLARHKEKEARKKTREAAEEKGHDANKKPTLALERYTGTFEDALSGPVEVKLEGERLLFAYNAKYVAELAPWEGDTFWATWRDPFVATWAGKKVTFAVDASGAARSVRVTFDNEVVFSR
ncbi:serine hydrolase [Chondromyces crocatus]|uniref:Serine hydrolase n=1 Tax=Chondromyces crocatus TaxID=52 RepID=A0A0K1EAN6_CHOCO|nr:serine hydrolase [Chondromyces crocatus]AKT37935.1 serine hydrolase [Chondromyces crocatus]